MLVNHKRISYWLNVPKNLAIGYKRHHVSLSTGGGLSDLLAWEEQGLKSATQAKKNKISR